MEQQQQQQQKLDSDVDMLLDGDSIPVTQQPPSPAGSDDSASGQQNLSGGKDGVTGATGTAGAAGTAVAGTAASAQSAGASTGRRRDNNFLEKLWK